MKLFYKIIAAGFGSGFSPIAPGTVGSLVGCFLVFLLNSFLPSENYFFQLCIVHCGLCILFLIIGIISINNLQSEWGHDSPKFTVDEIAGMLISVLFIPFSWQNILIGFVLFRFFDILKPFGIRQLEKVHGGWGVMLDDVLAGIFANIILQISLRFIF
ncbi:MAG: phosphatidylglycerophosphatase A [Bacteroidia bacterium]